MPEPEPFTEPTPWPEPPRHYGLRVWENESEDVIVEGHPPVRRALAAANRWARVECGMTNLYDTFDADLTGLRVHRMWGLADDDRWCPEGTPGAEPYTLLVR